MDITDKMKCISTLTAFIMEENEKGNHGFISFSGHVQSLNIELWRGQFERGKTRFHFYEYLDQADINTQKIINDMVAFLNQAS